MSTCKCPSLFQPGKIGSMELKNRAVMPAMGLSSTEGGFVNDTCIRHYVERAKGGFGLIVIEVTCVDAPGGLNTANMLRADDDKYIPGLTKLAAAIHDAGAKCVLEISHTGRGARRAITGLQPVGPSPIAMPMMYLTGVKNETPRELTVPEIHEIQDKYAAAARRAQLAGFDGVEIHSTGYYLGAQFLSPLSNQRTDEYGGPIENRFRFVEEICRKIRSLCGEEFALMVKTTVIQADGISPGDIMYVCRRMEEIGVDAIECIGDSTKVMPDFEDTPQTASGYFPLKRLVQLYHQHMVDTFPQGFGLKFVAGGNMRTSEMAQEVMDSGAADFVYFGKSSIVEPHIIRLMEEGREGEIHPCIGCFVCASDQLATGAHCYCSGNGAMANDSRFDLPPAVTPKKVVIIGAGPAGIEAAKVLKRRGHHPIILEKSDKLGGQVHYAMAPLHKDHFRRLIPYFYETVRANDIPVLLNTEATVETVLAQSPDAVICATGVRPGHLPVPGADLPHVCSGKEYFDGKPVEGKRVVVIGGGDVGCEVAEKLGAEGHEVALVEMRDTLAPGYTFGNRCCLLTQLRRYHVEVYLDTVCQEIRPDAVQVADKVGFLFDLPCDNVVLCTGDPANDALYQELRQYIPELYNIGDSADPSNLAMCHADAYRVAAMI